MKVAICIKQVPVVSLLKFDQEKRRLVREGVPVEVNPFDVISVSAVAKLKQSTPIEAVVLTMGPSQARQALVQCLAMGMDKALHLVDPVFAGSDTLATAKSLALALQREGFDLIICGTNSVDSETGQVGPQVAEQLGIPQITSVQELKITDSGKAITATRLTDEGYQHVNCVLPALITVGEGIATEQYPDRSALKLAETKTITEITATDLSSHTEIFGERGSPTKVNDIYPVEIDRDEIIVRDEYSNDVVCQLLEYLETRQGLFKEQFPAAERYNRGLKRCVGNQGPIWVVAEKYQEGIREVVFELLGKAVEIADEIETNVEAILFGQDAEIHSSQVTAYGADRVILIENTLFQTFDAEVYTEAMAHAIKSLKPYAVLFSSTANSRDLAARLASRLDLGLTGDCVGLETDSARNLLQLKPAFGGNIVAPITSRTVPQMATVRPGILDAVTPDFSIKPEVFRLDIASILEPRVRILEEIIERSVTGVELEHARVIVGVGKGIGGPHNLEIIHDLAEALGASIGSTRDVVDSGWLPRSTQIGLSGRVVSPQLYVAVGVRGPFNHVVGIKKAGVVVAINNNPRAPIFKSADFGVIGDYAKIIPTLTEALKTSTQKWGF